MKDHILDPSFELAPMGQDSLVSLYSTVVGCFQLLIDSHCSENDLLDAGGIFGGVAIECGLQILKPVVELGDIAIISQLGNIRWIKLDTLEARRWRRAFGVGFAVVIK